MKPNKRFTGWARMACIGVLSLNIGKVSGNDLVLVELQELAEFPPTHLEIGFGFELKMKVDAFENTDGSKEDLPAFQAKMDGTVEDADRHYQRGKIFSKSNDPDTARVEIRKAKEILEKFLPTKKEDASLRTKAGQLAVLLGETEEAERWYHQAVETSPKEWRNWMYLSHFYLVQAFQVQDPTYGQLHGSNASSLDFLKKWFQTMQDTERLREMAGYIYKAETHINQCLELGVRDANPNLIRLNVKLMKLAVEKLSSREGGQPVGPEEIQSIFFGKGFEKDVREMARIAASDVGVLLTSAAFAMMSAAVSNPTLELMKSPHADYPYEVREEVRYVMQRLEDLAHQSEDSLAGKALIGLALLNTMQGANQKALEDALKGIKLIPYEKSAWDLVITVLGHEKRFDEIIDLSDKFLKNHPLAEYYLVVAKAHFRQGEWDKAKDMALFAFARDRKNPTVLLSNAAITIRTASFQKDLDPAKELLSEAHGILNKIPQEDRKDDNYRKPMISLIKLAAIVEGLSGNRQQALELINQVVTNAPDDKEAKEIQGILIGVF